MSMHFQDYAIVFEVQQFLLNFLGVAGSIRLAEEKTEASPALGLAESAAVCVCYLINEH